MSMSRDDMKLHDPDVPWHVKLIVRLKRISNYGAQVLVGTIVIFLSVVLALIVFFGLPQLLQWLRDL